MASTQQRYSSPAPGENNGCVKEGVLLVIGDGGDGEAGDGVAGDGEMGEVGDRAGLDTGVAAPAGSGLGTPAGDAGH